MRKIKAIALTLAVFVFTGCSFTTNIDELIAPPKLTAQQNEIYKTLLDTIGDDIKLKYPRSGDYRSAFVMANIDQDTTDEAIVFYEKATVKNSENPLRVNILDNIDNKWVSVYDFAGMGTDIEEVAFSDLGQGSDKVIIGFSALNQTERTMAVISYASSKPSEIFSTSYTYMKVMDLNNDLTDELIIINQDKTTQLSKATLYKVDPNDVFYKVTETDAIVSATEYTNVTAAFLNENAYALIFDYSKGANQYGTDILTFNGTNLNNPIMDAQQSSLTNRLSNTNNLVMSSTDIDDDGYIEIPATIAFPGYGQLSKPEQFCATIWYTLKDEKLVRKYYSYNSTRNYYVFLFPERWTEFVTATTNSDLDEVVFYEYTPNEEYANVQFQGKEPLLRIKTVDQNAVNKDNKEIITELISNGYELFKRNGSKHYYVHFGSSRNPLTLSRSELEVNLLMQKTPD